MLPTSFSHSPPRSPTQGNRGVCVWGGGGDWSDSLNQKTVQLEMLPQAKNLKPKCVLGVGVAGGGEGGGKGGG